MDSSLAGLLGLARRAGKAELGAEDAAAAALAHKARLILVAEDWSESSRRRLERAAEAGGAPCFPWGGKAELGAAVGLASCAAVAVTDVGLASAALKKMAQADPARCGAASEELERKARKALRRKRERRASEASRPSKRK